MDVIKIYKQAVEIAEEDEKFRQSLLQNPKLALKDKLGIDIDEDINIQVFQSTSEHLHFVLPNVR